jgi:hypothetical protein
MGYYTRHEITIFDVSVNGSGNSTIQECEPDEAITDAFERITLYSDLLDTYGDSCKWYERKDSMVQISDLFPTKLFEIRGFGEENGDIWQEVWYQGRLIHEWKLGEIVFPDINRIGAYSAELRYKETVSPEELRGIHKYIESGVWE